MNLSHRTRTVLGALILAASMLVTLYVLVSVLFRTPSGPVDPWAVVVWLGFGVGVVVASRIVDRYVVLGAATVLAIIAGLDLFEVALPLVPDTIVPSRISASPYTWIAIAVLSANAFGRRGNAEEESQRSGAPSRLQTGQVRGF